MEESELSNTVEIQAFVPSEKVLQLNEELLQKTGELLYGGPQDWVWGQIHPEYVKTVIGAIEKHGGTLRDAPTIRLLISSERNDRPVEGERRKAA